METYRVVTLVSSKRSLMIEGLPFKAGEKVEVIVRRRERERERRERYPLRGTLVHTMNPFESVAESDWEALQ